MDTVIDVADLVFDYPGVRALDHVSLTVERGSITALVGPNGAGKTTLMRCLAALETPLQGRIRVDGVDVLEEPRRAHERLGYLQDFYGLYAGLSVRRCLIYAAGAQRVPDAALPERVRWAAGSLGLLGRLDQLAGALSRGLRQRLAIAQAIIHRPGVLLLDEPAAGLDPEARQELSGLLRLLCRDGMTILVSSHILAELEDYSTHMLIVRDGRIIEHRAVGTATTVPRMRLELAAPAPDLATLLQGIAGIGGIAVEGLAASFDFPGDAEARARLLRELVGRGLPVAAFQAEQHSLQDAYMAALRQPEAAR